MANLSVAFDVLTKGADKAANDLDRVGNSSEKTGRKVEKTGRKVEKTGGNMRLMASTFTSSSNQALGPLQEIANKFDVIAAAQENARTKAGGRRADHHRCCHPSFTGAGRGASTSGTRPRRRSTR